MSRNYDEFYWEKLDNAAKIYPSVTSKKSTNVYRVSVKLVEMVEPDLLQVALEKALEELPFFGVKLRKGFFWYYLERNFAKPMVSIDHRFPCASIDKFNANGFLFRLTYYNKMVNFDGFHVLTDGFGALYFIKTILLHYFKQKYPEQIKTDVLPEIEDASSREFASDSFLRHWRESEEVGKPYRPQAYRIKGVPLFNREIKVIHGIVSTKALLALAKEHDTTITIFLTAVLMYSIYKESFQYNMRKNRPIEISVPVNLRAYFDSSTLRNFFAVISTGMDFYQNRNIPFDEVLAFVKEDLKTKINREHLAAKIKYNVSAQQNIMLRAIPIPIKDLALKIIYKIGEKSLTSTLTNMGRITVPEELEPFIDRFLIHVWVNDVQQKKIGMCSYKDQMVISFTSGIEETSIEYRFFKILTDYGLGVTVSTNWQETGAFTAKKEDKG